MSEQQLLTVTIDGRTVQVPKGTLLVEAARQAGIEIPVFCYHPKLNPVGVCRMCLVEVEKIPKPQPACTTQVADGMVVRTQTERVADLRRGVLEFLLINHPLDCPVCDKGGECDLQDMTFKYGPTKSRVQDPKIRKDKAVELGNFIILDNERCVLCRRCVRFDDQIACEGNLIIEERGHFNRVTTMPGQRYDSYFSGNTVELCPVGALTSDLYRFQARPWDLSKAESICTGCSVGCSVNLEFRNGKLLRLTGRENEAVNDGWLCDRGRFNYKFAQASERITRPLIKQGSEYVPVSWSEALSYVAKRFQAIAAAKGGRGFGVIGGGKLTNEEAGLLARFARQVLRTENVDHRVGEQVVASLGAFPGRQSDLSRAQAILVVDVDPGETAPVMDLRIRRMVERKQAKLAAVGSVVPGYRARHARIQVRPGETAGVLRALAAEVAGKGSVESAADPESVRQLAALLGTSQRVAVVWGGECAATGQALVDLLGALRAAGSTVSLLIPGVQHNSRGAEAMGVLPGEGGLNTAQMLRAAAGGEIEALYLAGANLMSTFPDRKLVEAALGKAFVVAADLFMNETVALADVVLPAATIGEKSGTYTTLDGLVQAVRAAKWPEGEAQPDGEILAGLARALGAKVAPSSSVEPGLVLQGAPEALLTAGEGAEAPGDGLLLVPVDRLYAGGSTAEFDREFSRRALPRPKAIFSPADAARLGLSEGEMVALSAEGGKLTLPVATDCRVAPGTVQVIRRLSAAPVNLLTSGSRPVVVTVEKLAVEVAD